MCSASGPDHFGAQEATGAGLRIDVQQAAVPQHHARAALVLEGHGTGHVGDAAQRRVAAADHGHLRIAEHDAQTGTSQPGAHVGMACGVLTGDATLVGGLVQQRQVADWRRRRCRCGCGRSAACGGRRRARRCAPSASAGVLEPQSVDVRRAPGRGEQVGEALHLRAAVQRPIGDDDVVAVAGDVRVRVGVEVELARRSCAARTRPAPDRSSGPMPPPRPNTLTRTPRRCSAWPSSRPMTPGPKTATLSGRSSHSNTGRW